MTVDYFFLRFKTMHYNWHKLLNTFDDLWDIESYILTPLAPPKLFFSDDGATVSLLKNTKTFLDGLVLRQWQLDDHRVTSQLNEISTSHGLQNSNQTDNFTLMSEIEHPNKSIFIYHQGEYESNDKVPTAEVTSWIQERQSRHGWDAANTKIKISRNMESHVIKFSSFKADDYVLDCIAICNDNGFEYNAVYYVIFNQQTKTYLIFTYTGHSWIYGTEYSCGRDWEFVLEFTTDENQFLSECLDCCNNWLDGMIESEAEYGEPESDVLN